VAGGVAAEIGLRIRVAQDEPFGELLRATNPNRTNRLLCSVRRASTYAPSHA